MFWPTIVEVAVLSEFVTMDIVSRSFAPMPVTAEATSPYSLIQEVTSSELSTMAML